MDRISLLFDFDIEFNPLRRERYVKMPDCVQGGQQMDSKSVRV
jgi:hypothetical protein